MIVKSIPSSAAAAFCLTLLACGGSAATGTSATVGTAGATLRTGSTTLTIPAGAIPSGTATVTLKEVEPHHPGRATRVEIEIEHGPLSIPGSVAVKVDDTNATVRMHQDDGAAERQVGVEVEDRNHHEYKTGVSGSCAIEVELEHGAACATACAASEECDDGTCKPHVGDATAAACSAVCAPGLECDHGTCKPHSS